MKNIDVLLGIILLSICWLIFSVLILLHIRAEAKKKWHKNEEIYPYFHYPFYKKIFLLGLKGAISFSNVIATFLFNISLIVLLVSGIWYLIAPNTILMFIYRIDCGVYLVAFLLKIGLYGFKPIKFK